MNSTALSCPPGQMVRWPWIAGLRKRNMMRFSGKSLKFLFLLFIAWQSDSIFSKLQLMRARGPRERVEAGGERAFP